MTSNKQPEYKHNTHTFAFYCEKLKIELWDEQEFFVSVTYSTNKECNDFLDGIGKQKAMEYWGLVERDNISPDGCTDGVLDMGGGL